MGSEAENRVRVGVVIAVVLSAFVSRSAAAQGTSASRPTAAQATRFDGPAVQGGLVVGHADPGSRVTLDGRRIRLARDGTFLVGFGMDAPKTMALAVVRPDGSHEAHTFLVEQRQYATERIDDLPEAQVDLDRQTRGALQRARRRIEQARRRFTPADQFTNRFQWPAHGRVSSSFGVRRILNGQPRDVHDAIDIAVPVGTVVRAPADGVVAFTSEDVPLAGRMVIIDHGLGLTSTFLHLSELRVRPGDRVEHGATLGLSGETGRTTGPHLEWDVHLSGVALDPERLVSPAHVPNPAVSR